MKTETKYKNNPTVRAELVEACEHYDVYEKKFVRILRQAQDERRRIETS